MLDDDHALRSPSRVSGVAQGSRHPAPTKDLRAKAPVDRELWDRWGRGESLRSIASALSVSRSLVATKLAARGGTRPPQRRRHRRHLTTIEREEVSRGIAAGLSLRAIARQLHRSPSSVAREVSRNGGRETYRATAADSEAWRRAQRPKVHRLASKPALLEEVRGRLERDWSPEQISASLRRDFPAEPSMWISHETIYRSIFVSSRGELGKAMVRHLRSARSVRQPRRVRSSHGRGRLRNMVTIHDRPVSVADRLETGHWEGDLVMGKRPSAVATLVERSTRFVRIVSLPDGIKADAVRDAIAADLQQVPTDLRRSLTWDRGREMARHQELAARVNIDVYFCDPRSPWQRGTNENTNRLLRQYLAKNDDLRRFGLRDLADIAERINDRPRRTLGWLSAADLYEPLARSGARRDVERLAPAGPGQSSSLPCERIDEQARLRVPHSSDGADAF